MSEIRTDIINNASGDNDSGIDLSTNDQVSIKTANTTALTVDASQNVGIGGTIDNHGGYARVLQITGAGESAIELENSSGYGYLAMNGTAMQLRNVANGNMLLYTNNTERSRIDSSGRMLLNTTTHTNGRLNVTESLNIQPCLGLRSSYASNTGNFVLFTSNDGTGAGAISHINASTVAYNTSSDYRLKQNVTYDFDATTRLKQLQPARFSWNHDDTNTLVDGFLAHEVQSVVPEAITGNKDAVDADGNPIYQFIDQSKLVPLLVKTIQELEARITALENA